MTAHKLTGNPVLDKWITRLNNMKENASNEHDKMPDGEVFIQEQMISQTAETIRDLKSLIQTPSECFTTH
jgi:hypothetical protein